MSTSSCVLMSTNPCPLENPVVLSWNGTGRNAGRCGVEWENAGRCGMEWENAAGVVWNRKMQAGMGILVWENTHKVCNGRKIVRWYCIEL